MASEEWRPVCGFPGYEVSSEGRVRSVDRIVNGRKFLGVTLIQRPTRFGYMKVDLSVGGVAKTKAVHVLVCIAFHGPRPDGMEAAHEDGDKLNNRAWNLKWKTREDNERDKLLHGTAAVGARNGKHTKPFATPRGEAAGKSNLTTKVVLKYREMMRSGQISIASAAAKMGIAKSSALAIKSGKSWSHV